MIGFFIAAPVGPIGILGIRRTLATGKLSGLFSGLGAESVDAFYGSMSAGGLTVISTVLIGHQVWLRLIGGVFFCYLSFAAIFSGIGLGSTPGCFAPAARLVGGVFLGLAAWWTLPSSGVSLLRKKVSSDLLL